MGFFFAVSRIGMCMDPPTAGTVAAIEHVAGYLRQHSTVSLMGQANSGVDEYTVMCDAIFVVIVNSLVRAR